MAVKEHLTVTVWKQTRERAVRIAKREQRTVPAVIDRAVSAYDKASRLERKEQQ